MKASSVSTRVKAYISELQIGKSQIDKLKIGKFQIAATLMVVMMSASAHAVVLEFESYPTSSSGGISAGYLSEEGYDVRTISGSFSVFEDGWQNGRGAGNGTNTIGHYNAGSSEVFKLTSETSTPFSISSIDLSGFFQSTDGAYAFNADSVEFRGTFSDGSTIVDNFILDTINDGPGGVDDFETYHFSTDWQDLTSVFFTSRNEGQNATYLSFDNIVVNPFNTVLTANLAITTNSVSVPLPSTIALFALGLVGFGFTRKKN